MAFPKNDQGHWSKNSAGCLCFSFVFWINNVKLWFFYIYLFVLHLRRIEELTCGGMVEQVQEAFGETMTSVVSLCARYPIACANSIGLLCTIPYTRQANQF